MLLRALKALGILPSVSNTDFNHPSQIMIQTDDFDHHQQQPLVELRHKLLDFQL